MIIKIYKLVLIFFSLVLSLNAKEVRITGHPDYPPIVWKKDGQLVGSAVTIVKKALENIGYKVKLVPIDTWGRAQEEVRLGRVDILLPPYKTPERERVYAFPEKPFLMDSTALFYKEGNKVKFEEFKDLKAYSGVAIINDSFGEEFDKADEKYKLLKRLKKTEQCFQYLYKDRADYVVAGQNAASVVLNKIGLAHKIHVHEKLVVETGMFTAISKKSKYNTSEFKTKFFKEVEKLISAKFDLKATSEALKLVKASN